MNKFEFEKYIAKFREIKKNSKDLQTEIGSQIINEPIKKMLWFINNKKLENWLYLNFNKYDRELLYIKIADLYLSGELDITDRRDICEYTIRTVLAIATEGVVSTPLEGIQEVYIEKNNDGTQYLGIKYAGPIRAAGATAGGLTVLIATYLSQKLGLKYNPDEKQLVRYIEQCGQYTAMYPQIINPTEHQITQLVQNLIFCVDGVAAEKQLVNVHRYIPRVSTPFLRGGAMLIFCVLIIKCRKIIDLSKIMGLDFSFLLKVYEKSMFDASSGSSSFLNSVVAGRAVFGMPSIGGFRLRVGRARNTGLGSEGLSPVTIKVLNFLNVGSQMMTSTPGKATVVVPVTDLEGPIVELKDGQVISLDLNNYSAYIKNIKSILHLGEILIAYGEFIENKIKLKEIDHSLDYWRIKYGPIPEGTEFEQLQYCLSCNYMILPFISPITLNYPIQWWANLRTYFLNEKSLEPRYDLKIHEQLKMTGLNYTVSDKFKFKHESLFSAYFLLDVENIVLQTEVYDTLIKYSKYVFPKKGAVYIGARLAAVEGAGLSEIGTGVNMIYRLKSTKIKVLQEYAQKVSSQKVLAQVLLCMHCKIESVQRYCIQCKRHNVIHPEKKGTLETHVHDLNADIMQASNYLKMAIDIYPIKVTHELDRFDYWDAIEKGILRAKHKVTTFRDGVVHFSASNVVLTQFRPIECGLSVEKAIQLGYTKDIYGKPLTKDTQMLNLKIHDIILPIKLAGELIKITKYVDELLIKYYKTESHHKCRTISDLLGLKMATIAPHILNGVCCRVIGFVNQYICYRHPLLVAACRRNADGDRDCYVVLSNLLLDYAKHLLKNGNGRYMNIFAILSTEIYINSVDKEVTNLDICEQYDLKFYETRDLSKIEFKFKKCGDILPGEEATAQYMFTTPTDYIVLDTPYNAYKDLITLEDKIDAQLELAKVIQNVSVGLVLEKVIEGHLIKDVIGNTRKFLKQAFRCTSCNIRYQVLPLDGNCKKCKSIVNYTVHPKSAGKYIDIIKKYFKVYNNELSPYMKSAIQQTIAENEDIIPLTKPTIAGFRKFIK